MSKKARPASAPRRLEEGQVRKGGVNRPPTKPRPNVTPVGQSPRAPKPSGGKK